MRKNRKIKLDHWNEPDFIPFRVKNLPGEIWKVIDGFTNYEVSNMGRIKRVEREHHAIRYYAIHGRSICTARYYSELLMAQGQSGKTPYLKVSLINDVGKQITLLVHRLVLAAFVPNINNLPHVHHKDANPKNNRLENLEWSSVADNMSDATHRRRVSMSKKGKKRPPMTEAQKSKIRKTMTENKVNCKPVICGKMIYPSAKAMAESEGYAASTIRNWLNGYQPMPEKFKKLNLRYK